MVFSLLSPGVVVIFSGPCEGAYWRGGGYLRGGGLYFVVKL